jgi:peptidoglycan/LPS O-acetylase OafA/YrhL
MSEERLNFIDKASGIAMLLVVYGHLIFPETLQLGWWQVSRDFIYKFHMPLFMVISGFLVFLSTSKKNIQTGPEYRNFQKKKFQKFFPAYLFFSILALIVDFVFFHQPVEKLSESILAFFFYPDYGSAGFVWYLYVLMGFYLITPFLLKLPDHIKLLLLFAGFLLTNATFSIYFCADLFAKYFFFFLGGGMIFLNLERFMIFIRKFRIPIIVISILLVVIDFRIDLKLPYQLISVSLTVCIFYLSTLNWSAIFNKVFISMGRSAFAIYLLNTSVLNVYYYLYKMIFKLPIDTVFVFTCLVVTIILSILIKITFNKFVPKNIYSLS